MLKFSRPLISIALVALVTGMGIAALPTVALAKPAENCTPGPGLDLIGCSYVNADLTGDNFSGSDLRNANFSGADLNATNFSNADLRHANLSLAGMVFDCGQVSVFCPISDLNGDNLTFAVNPNFTNADLHGANLNNAALKGTQEVTQVCFGLPLQCILVNGIYPDAILTGVKSGGILGTTISLPNGWELIDGYLTVPPPALQITSPSNLPTATRGVAYSTLLTAAGGNPPFKWSVVGGVLPTGLHLGRASGSISGTPRSSGTFDFIVQVVDTKTHQPTTQRMQTMTFSLQVT
jgi:hypothetical protein